MSCCDDTESDDGGNEIPKVRGCTDVYWLVIYILFWFLMVSCNSVCAHMNIST